MADRVLGVLGGDDLAVCKVLAWARSATRVIAADGGANVLVDGGFVPDVIVGDLDSVHDASGAQVLHQADQDMTDAGKMLRLIAAEGHREATLVGLEGDLLDHLLGTLAEIARSPLDLRLALRRGLAWTVRPGRPVARPAIGERRVSLIPLAPCVGAELEGVRWPLSGVELALDGLVSVSNRSTHTEVVARVAQGVALLFVETHEGETPCW
jgi:thiamine pyrophosphokinase